MPPDPLDADIMPPDPLEDAAKEDVVEAPKAMEVFEEGKEDVMPIDPLG